MSVSNDDEGNELRAALQMAVANICTQSDDNSFHDGAIMTTSAICTLTELTYLYATTTLANDLVAFVRHANRRTIQPDDVLLVVRENPNQWRTSSLSKWERESLEENSSKKSNKRSITPSKEKYSKRRSQEELHRRVLMGTDSEADEDNYNDDDDDDISDVVIPKQMKESKSLLSKRLIIHSDSSDNDIFASVTKPGLENKKTKTSRKVEDRVLYSSSDNELTSS
jgi:histone H3/H4